MARRRVRDAARLGGIGRQERQPIPYGGPVRPRNAGAPRAALGADHSRHAPHQRQPRSRHDTARRRLSGRSVPGWERPSDRGDTGWRQPSGRRAGSERSGAPATGAVGPAETASPSQHLSARATRSRVRASGVTSRSGRADAMRDAPRAGRHDAGRATSRASRRDAGCAARRAARGGSGMPPGRTASARPGGPEVELRPGPGARGQRCVAGWGQPTPCSAPSCTSTPPPISSIWASVRPIWPSNWTLSQGPSCCCSQRVLVFFSSSGAGAQEGRCPFG